MSKNMIDWNQYQYQFPVRYWQQGNFDRKLKDLLESLNQYDFKIAVDIGGGMTGTLVLRDFAKKNNIVTDLLDPYIDVKPDWIRQKIDWNTKKKYDLLVARGCINYLTTNELYKLKSMMAKKSVLIFNTFQNLPSQNWSKRNVLNAYNEVGIEESRFHNNMIEHRITFPNYQIAHNFYYYSLDFFKEIFIDIEVESYGQNSTLIKVVN